MKKQLSLTLLTISIFSLNILPTHAAGKNKQKTRITAEKTEYSTNNSGQWCFEVPLMGFFCVDL